MVVTMRPRSPDAWFPEVKLDGELDLYRGGGGG
jgi:hypothetical protein